MSNGLTRFSVAEQVISAIYSLAKHPDVLCTEIIQRKTKTVFENQLPVPFPADPAEDQVMQEAGLSEEPDASSGVPQDASFFPLSQLLFVVGHVASKVLRDNMRLWLQLMF
jgi:condensin complex subunit 1